MYKYKIPKPKRSWKNKSHEFKFDTGFGTLIPILCEDVLPNTTIRLSTELFTRFSALIAPAFQRCDARLEYFFVPDRIIYDDFEKFIDNPDDQTLQKPYFRLQDCQDFFKANTLADYLGFPVNYGTGQNAKTGSNEVGGQKVDAMPFRAYYKIWYDYYRDENVMTADGEPRANGGQLSFAAEGDIMRLQSRCYPRDYFTSALPYAQQSNPVRLPLTVDSNAYGQIKSDKTVTVQSLGITTNGIVEATYGSSLLTSNRFKLTNLNGMIQGPTIEEVRRSSAVQKWLERNMRFGSRYVESVAAHFGIRVPDYRLDRPEYIGGGKINVRISEVLSHVDTQSYPLGEEGGHAVASGSSQRIKYKALEHGWVIGLLSFVPKASYGQGWPRKYNRWSPLDYGWTEFDNLGEQPLYLQELYAYGGQGDTVFGYKPRYDEYKHGYDRYAGQFRESLAYWHLGRIFGSDPTLSPQFVGINYSEIAPQSDPDRLTRMFATDDQRNIIVDLYNHFWLKSPLSSNESSIIK